MDSFNLLGVDYHYIYYNPAPRAKYGLGLSFWSSNVLELFFFLQYINKSWLNRDLIDISVCSHARITGARLEELKTLCNHIIVCDKDYGKERGTMAHLNGSLFPFWQNDNIKAAMHTDADEIVINDKYFFGLFNILLDSEKVLLGAKAAYHYDMHTLKKEKYYETGWADPYWDEVMHSFIILNKSRIPFGTYYPIIMKTHFHLSLAEHFHNVGFTWEDAIILERHEWNYDVPTNFLYSFDFHTGILRSANNLEYPETEDRKIRLIKLNTTDQWENMPEGWLFQTNSKSHRPGYQHGLAVSPDNYQPVLPIPRPNKLRNL